MCHSKTAVPQTAVVFDCGLVMRFNAANEWLALGGSRSCVRTTVQLFYVKRREMLNAYASELVGSQLLGL